MEKFEKILKDVEKLNSQKNQLARKFHQEALRSCKTQAVFGKRYIDEIMEKRGESDLTSLEFAKSFDFKETGIGRHSLELGINKAYFLWRYQHDSEVFCFTLEELYKQNGLEVEVILLPVVGRSWLDDEELDAVVDEIVKYSSNIFTRFIGFFCLDSDCEPAVSYIVNHSALRIGCMGKVGEVHGHICTVNSKWCTVYNPIEDFNIDSEE